MDMTIQKTLKDYPMGPKVRHWLGITAEEYQGELNSRPGLPELELFESALLERMSSEELKSGDLLTDLIEELVGMNLPLLALKLADAYPNLLMSGDFRTYLHLGNASMLTGDLARAEDCFFKAQGLVPEEPAPYVNLVQIYCEDRLYEKALQWCIAGLRIEPNYFRLWELFAWIQQQLCFDEALVQVQKLAVELNSWAGQLLLVDLTSQNDRDPDPSAKLKVLSPHYQEGCRDLDFLVEYTAALGLAGLYEQIPSILWQTEKSEQKDIPWQLYFHTVQAYFGLARDDQGIDLAKKMLSFDNLPERVEAELNLLIEDKGQSLH